jgi:hypothetical protein
LLVFNATASRTERGDQRISSWAAVLFAPTLVASVYGMNFDYMPEPGQPWGYPMALLLMIWVGRGSVRHVQTSELAVAARRRWRRGWAGRAAGLGDAAAEGQRGAQSDHGRECSTGEPRLADVDLLDLEADLVAQLYVDLAQLVLAVRSE